jgi:hypothetical protein
MKLIQKTSSKIVLEVNKGEIDKTGFDDVWDKVRSVYPEEQYDVLSVSDDPENRTIVFIELKVRIEE